MLHLLRLLCVMWNFHGGMAAAGEGQGITFLQNPGRPSFKGASSCGPLFTPLSHSLPCFFTHSEVSARRIVVSGGKVLFYSVYEHFIQVASKYTVSVSCGSAVVLTGGSHRRGMPGRCGERTAGTLGEKLVKHCHTGELVEVPCSVRLYQVATYSGLWRAAAFLLITIAARWTTYLPRHSWGFVRAFLLALHCIGSSVQYQAPPFKRWRILLKVLSEKSLDSLSSLW